MINSSCWVTTRRVAFIDRRFGTPCFHFVIDSEGGTNRCSETSANKHNTPGSNPKTRISKAWNNITLMLSALPDCEYEQKTSVVRGCCLKTWCTTADPCWTIFRPKMKALLSFGTSRNRRVYQSTRRNIAKARLSINTDVGASFLVQRTCL
jgi:hypothetical protein